LSPTNADSNTSDPLVLALNAKSRSAYQSAVVTGVPRNATGLTHGAAV
jgi:hypothetical protein